jgi:hypothetical protein
VPDATSGPGRFGNRVGQSFREGVGPQFHDKNSLKKLQAQITSARDNVLDDFGQSQPGASSQPSAERTPGKIEFCFNDHIPGNLQKSADFQPLNTLATPSARVEAALFSGDTSSSVDTLNYLIRLEERAKCNLLHLDRS